jgi:hypothetical protein
MRMRLPNWYGKKYPSIEDMESYAALHGAIVARGSIPGALYVPGGAVEPESPPMILLPIRGPLEMAWLFAHELGHLVQHAGRRGEYLRSKDEAAADRWAARALIPEAAVRRHRNASLDAFIAALSAHYEDLPLEDCPQRRLAARIANIRLKAVEEVA